MNKLQYIRDKRALLGRLNRVEGQVRGISRMVALEDDSMDIVTQISATKAALNKIALELVRDNACRCAPTDKSSDSDSEQQVEQIITALKRLG